MNRNYLRWCITAENVFEKSSKSPHRETENEGKIDFDFLGPQSTSNDRPDRPKTAKNSLYRRMPIVTASIQRKTFLITTLGQYLHYIILHI